MLGGYAQIGRGSEKIFTDIVGSFENNHILLVNATTGLPKQSDFDIERECGETIEKSISNKKLKIHSAYFAGKNATESFPSANSDKVNLVGKSSLLLILEHLKKGKWKKIVTLFCCMIVSLDYTF